MKNITEAQLVSLKASIERLEKKVFGGVVEKWVDEKEIFLSKKGLQTFPEMRKDKFFLIRWSRNHHDLIVVRREGRKSLTTYHHSFFIIK